MIQSKVDAILKLNEQLSQPKELCGVFLPSGAEQRDDLLLLAEMPSMNEPKGSFNGPFNFNVTKRDRFFQDMLVKSGLSGVYVTDIVKRRDFPRRPSKSEVEQWLPFLKKEISILCPKMVIVIGKTTYYNSFLRHVAAHIDDNILHDFIFHYTSRVPREKFETRLSEVVSQYDLCRK